MGIFLPTSLDRALLHMGVSFFFRLVNIWELWRYRAWGGLRGSACFHGGVLLVQKRPEFFNFRRLTFKSQNWSPYFLDLFHLSTLGRPLKIAAAVFFFLFHIATGQSGGLWKKVK